MAGGMSMPNGWSGAILDVDLATGAIGRRDTLAYARDYLGGRALAARLAWDEIPGGCAPYDPQNRILICTGPLTGTLAPTAGRTIMGSLSPRFYPRPWYTHSTLGGWFGPALKYAGYDALVIRGRAEAPVYLEIRDDRVRLVGADDLKGRGARETQRVLTERAGRGAQVLAIGPAGEHLVRFATVQHSEENAAGHSGFGAVWGAKNLKAVVVRGSGGVRVAQPQALLGEVLGAGKFKIAPSGGVMASEEAKGRGRPVCTQACTYNCLVATYGRSTDGRRLVGHCIGNTPWLEASIMKATRYSGGDVEIPAGVNFDVGVEGDLHLACNDLGLDMWFRLVMQPWFQRCRQLGVSAIRGFALEPEDASWLRGFMQQLAHREGLGAIFADDLVRAMDELEGELPPELIALGRELEFGFGMPAHREGRFWDEEPLPFWVVSAMMYASESRDPTIGSHQSFMILSDFVMGDNAEGGRRQLSKASQKIWGAPDAFEPAFEGKAPMAIWTQHQHMLIDSLPLCDFAFPQVVRPMGSAEEWLHDDEVIGDLDVDRRLLQAVTGEAYTREELTLVAERAFTLERLLLARAGRNRAMEEMLAPHFRLPCRADGTSIDAEGFSRLLDEYYAARGWDARLGWPMPEQLRALGLGDAVPEVERLRADRTSR